MHSRRMERRVAVVAVVLAAAVPWLLAAAEKESHGVELGLLAATLSLCVSCMTFWGFRNAGWLRGAQRISRVSWRADGSWLLQDERGNVLEAKLRADSRIAGRILWLRWNAAGVRSMLLAPGDAAEPQLRRLRTRLRLNAYHVDGDGTPTAAL